LRSVKGKLLLFILLATLPLIALDYNVKSLQKKFYQTVTLSTLFPDTKIYDISKDNHKLLKRIQKIYISYSYWNALKTKIGDFSPLLSHSQFVTAIDLSRQLLIVTLWDKDQELFYFIGSDLISSGNMEKEKLVVNGEDHYLKTPAGVFKVKSGWRSDGKVLDDNLTLPYGQKGRFVYYFGKQKSIRYNTFDQNGTKITDKKDWQLIEGELEFAIHAHKSSAWLGQAFSHGCIRMSHELNVFLDTNLVLHKHAFNENNEWDMKYGIEPPRYDINSSFAGEYLFIFDTILDTKN
jgi:hypothetical protein